MSEFPLELTPDIARIRGLYKLLPVTTPSRVLEIVASGENSVVFENLEPSEIQLISANVERLGYSGVDINDMQIHALGHLFAEPPDAEKYDLIIMHGTFSRLKSSLNCADKASTNPEIFTALNNLLNSTGIVAGCVRNHVSLAGITSLTTRQTITPGLSFRRLKGALEYGGFGQPRIYSLYPGRFSPISMAEVNLRPSVTHSRSQIGYLRNWLGKSNYRLKLLLSLLGISLWFEDEYFFYAEKS